jgi:hypothetical protein
MGVVEVAVEEAKEAGWDWKRTRVSVGLEERHEYKKEIRAFQHRRGYRINDKGFSTVPLNSEEMQAERNAAERNKSRNLTHLHSKTKSPSNNLTSPSRSHTGSPP